MSRLLKFKGSLAEYRHFYKALLQKRPEILRNLLIVATLYLFAKVTSCFRLVGNPVFAGLFCKCA